MKLKAAPWFNVQLMVLTDEINSKITYMAYILGNLLAIVAIDKGLRGFITMKLSLI